jgi:hypothetical protein
MTQTISRIYKSHKNAEAAVSEAKRVGFAEQAITVVAPPSSETPDQELMASIARGGVASTHATAFAEAIRSGETLVSIRAPFGHAATAITILEKHHPTETGLGDQGYERPPPDPAAPFSSWAGWRVLSDNPAPLSSALSWPTLSSRQPVRKPDEDLFDDPAPLSRTFGMRLLSDKPAPLSKRLGWKLLSHEPAPLSKRLGWATLSREKKAPEARFGMKLLSDNPAPLSSRFGWKLLSNNPAPLSSWLNWRVLSRDRSE